MIRRLYTDPHTVIDEKCFNFSSTAFTKIYSGLCAHACTKPRMSHSLVNARSVIQSIGITIVMDTWMPALGLGNLNFIWEFWKCKLKTGMLLIMINTSDKVKKTVKKCEIN